MFENEKSYDDATQTHSYSFGPTMKMSPYLLAFVISDYQIDSAQGPVHLKTIQSSRRLTLGALGLVRKPGAHPWVSLGVKGQLEVIY